MVYIKNAGSDIRSSNFVSALTKYLDPKNTAPWLEDTVFSSDDITLLVCIENTLETQTAMIEGRETNHSFVIVQTNLYTDAIVYTEGTGQNEGLTIIDIGIYYGGRMEDVAKELYDTRIAPLIAGPEGKVPSI